MAASKHILGAQGNIWTEFIPTTSQAEYMALPRMTALAEILWSPQDSLDWHDFRNRLNSQFSRFKALGVNYCEGSYKVNMIPEIDPKSGKYDLTLETEDPYAEIRYTTNGSIPNASSIIYKNPIPVDSDAKFNAVAFKDGKLMETPHNLEITIHKAIGQKVIYTNELSFKYPGTGDIPLVDGIHGSLYYNDATGKDSRAKT